ncbi:MAG: 4a-hydroxytetrahydrobiopterin dehydratase [Bacteroidetes bacterium]|nr:4a-hydroxytetrahydrobiopterin dehydratase [Bacteroidota bacterium]
MENWIETDNKLYRKFKFDSFSRAILFMSTAAEKIDALDHHPEWKNVYNRVEVWLCTHSEGNVITKKDRELAAILDKIYEELT